MSAMLKLMSYLVIVAGFAVAAYVGVYEGLFLGCVDVFDGFAEGSGRTFATGVVRIVFAEASAAITVVLTLITSTVMRGYARANPFRGLFGG